MALKLVFMGSPDFAIPALAALSAAGHEIACVYTQPPRRADRGRQVKPTPVHAFAGARGLAVRAPNSLKRQTEQQALAELGADLIVVVAYGLILPLAALEAGRLGALNLHASLLPRWRGAAPIQRALMAGDRVTGVQAMKMEEGLDTGPILISETTAIGGDDTAGALHDRLAAIGAPLLARAVDLIETGQAQFTPQASMGVTYADKIVPAETRIDWSKPAREVDLQIRGLSPSPSAWFENAGVRVKTLFSRVESGAGSPGTALDDRLLIACGDGAVRLLRVQREGRAAMDAEEFRRGTPIAAGVRIA